MTLANKSLVNIFTNLSQAILGFLLGVFLARKLLPEGIGIYQVYLSAASIISLAGTVGMGQAGLFYINTGKGERGHVIYNLLVVTLVLALASSVLMWLLGSFFVNYFSRIPKLVLVVFSVGVGAFLTCNILRYLFLADLEIWKLFFCGVFTRGLPLVLLLGAMTLMNISVSLSLAAYTAGSVAALIYFLIRLGRKGDFCWTHLDTWLIVSMGKYGFPLCIFSCLQLFITNASVLLLRWIIPDNFAQVGYFGRAVALANLVVLIPNSIGPILYAQWSKSKGCVAADTVQFAVRINMILSITTAAIVVVFAKPIIIVLYGPLYSAAIPALQVLVTATVFKAIFDVWLNLLIARGKTKIVPIISGVSVVILVLGMYLLVPLFGIIGASMTIVLSNFVAAVLGFREARKIYSVGMTIQSLCIRTSDLGYIAKVIKNLISKFV